MLGAAALLAVWTAGARGQDPQGPAPRLECAEPDFHFGERVDTEVVEHRFLLRNTGGAPLHIGRVHASCGCTVASVSTNVIPPGGEADLAVRFTLSGRRGAQNKSITVESDDPANPRFRLWVRGTIIVEVDLEPRYLNFRQVHARERVSQEARLVTIDPAVRITNAVCPSPAFDVAVGADGRTLTVTTVPPLPEGVLRESVSVETDHPGGRGSGLVVLAVVLGDLTVVPRQILLRRSEAGPQSRSVLLRATRGQPFTVTHTVPPLPTVTVTTNVLEDGAVSLTLEGLTADAALEGRELVIGTDQAGMPECRVPVRIVP